MSQRRSFHPATSGFQPSSIGFSPQKFVPGHAVASPPKLGQSLVEDILKGAWGPWGDVAFRGLTGTALIALSAMSEMPGLIKAILYLAGGLWVLQSLTIAIQQTKASRSIEV